MAKYMASLANQEALLAEEKKLRRLGRAMDVAVALLWKVDLTLEEAQDVVDHAKRTALQLFPDKEATFDLIYGARLRRVLVEKYRLQ
jgi:ribulose kinase